jgi:F-box and leucine-rich repeat protein GRR1
MADSKGQCHITCLSPFTTMASIYKHHFPSSTSLSDDNDDDDIQFHDQDSRAFFITPARWSNKRSIDIIPFKESTHSPMSGLPPEILIHILKHLHSPRDLFNCLRVSRTWCECAVELLWHKPAFPKYDTLEKMARLLTKPDQSFNYSHFIRRLNFLSLGSQLKDDVFSIFARCDRLERLTLVNCEYITSVALSRILPCFTDLVAIDLSGAIRTNNDAIISLALSAKRLQGINLAGCTEVSDDGIVALALNCPLLRRVKLSNLENLTDSAIQALAKCCPLLLEIDLNHCHLITDIAIRDIWLNSTYMRELRLSHCPQLTDAAFPAPLRPELIAQTDNANPFPYKSKLDNDLPPLILNRQFIHLRMLDLTGCSLISDEAIEGIICQAPKIRNLVLSKCTLLTDRSVENICKLGRHLHYLHLGHASKTTDRSVRTLARSCTRLRYVDFASEYTD